LVSHAYIIDARQADRHHPAVAGKESIMRGLIAVLISLILAFTLIAISGCAPEETALVVAFVPSVESQTIIDQLETFESELSKRIGMDVKAVAMPSYAACVETMGTGKTDVAFLPPMAYVLGHSRYGIDVLLKVERRGQTVYRGEIIVRNDSGIETLEELNGKKFAFVDPASASGYLYPKALLLEHGVDVEEDPDQVIFAVQHPSVAVAVMNGQVDAGACFDDARELAEDAAPGVLEATKVLAYTKDIPADTVSVRNGLDGELKAGLSEALIDMASGGKESFLYKIYQIEGLHPATDDDYEPLREVGETLGLNFEEFIDKG
jgi:phosphonate transport system substrate-binding protein